MIDIVADWFSRQKMADVPADVNIVIISWADVPPITDYCTFRWEDAAVIIISIIADIDDVFSCNIKHYFAAKHYFAITDADDIDT